ncbi:MAG: hypothetical protein ACOZIN_06920 [Myxococcota bacterium]
MSNKGCITPKQFQETERHIDAALESVDQFAIHIDNRGEMLKMRSDGEWVALHLADVMVRHAVKLPVDAEQIQEQLTRAARIRPLRDKAERLFVALDDSLFDAQSKTWSMATACYSALTAMSRLDIRLAKDLEPVVEFFSTGSRKPKNGHNGDEFDPRSESEDSSSVPA